MSEGRTRRFDGAIAGIGTLSGIRFVVGMWDDTPFGPITDVMIERPDGHRLLVAPTDEVGRFIRDMYGFDELRIESVTLDRSSGRTTVQSDSVSLAFGRGRRTVVGWLLAAVPRPIARALWWNRVTDPIARLARPGVRTIGTAGNGHRERYCALDEHALTEASVRLDGVDAGPLHDIDPPVRFGFGSTPRRPSIVRITTYVD